jgi:hypothetical protein
MMMRIIETLLLKGKPDVSFCRKKTIFSMRDTPTRIPAEVSRKTKNYA